MTRRLKCKQCGAVIRDGLCPNHAVRLDGGAVVGVEDASVVRVSTADLQALLADRASLRLQVEELQTEGTKLALERQARLDRRELFDRMWRQTEALAFMPCEFKEDPPCHGCATCYARETVLQSGRHALAIQEEKSR